MKWSVKLVTMKGVTVYLHLTFLLFLIWMVTVSVVPGATLENFIWSLLLLAAVFTSILLHEYGHALVAGVFGIDARKITLYPIGGIASIDKLPQNPGQELLISAAGPVVSLLLAGACWLLSPYKDFFQISASFTGLLTAEHFFPMLGAVNLLLALFNLIPAFPMDGGRMLRALLAFRFNYIKATAIAAIAGKLVAVVFILYGLVTINLFLVFIGLFVLVFAQAEQAYLQLEKLVQGLQVKDMLMYDYNSLDADLTTLQAANVLQQNHSKYFILMRNGQPVGSLNRMAVMKSIADQRFNVQLSSLMRNDLVSLDSDATVDSVLQKLSAREEKIYPVLDHGRFVGVINFQQVIEHLLLHNTNTKDFIKTRSLVELV